MTQASTRVPGWHPQTNEERNKELVFKRLENDEKWTWAALGKLYGIHRQTAKDLFYRWRHVYEPEFKKRLKG